MPTSNYEQHYLSVLQQTLYDGVVVPNKRTGVNCYTSLNHTFTYQPDEFPLVTTRKAYWKQAISEMLCYIRGYTDLNDFHALGVHTWDANCDNWKSSYKEHSNDCGIIYGASSEAVNVSYNAILGHIKINPTDRGIIWNFWNPEYFHLGCLRPCMMTHHFSVLNDTLYLTSYQRSADLPLGSCFNMVQAWFLLAITAKLAGLQMGTVTHHVTNCHIYENQIEGVKEQLTRKPLGAPKFFMKENITFEDIQRNITKDNFDEYFWIEDYQHYPPIKYPFTV